MNQTAHKVVFVDRDGTINVDHGYVHRVDDWEFTDRAAEALKRLRAVGYKLAVVTNQSGIARGYYTAEMMHELHKHMEAELAKEGAGVDVVAFCPHDRDSTCECRKPNIDMARHAEHILGPIDYAQSWTVGDKEADIQFGRTAGTRTALIRSEYWTEEGLKQQPDLVVDSLWEFTQRIASEK